MELITLDWKPKLISLIIAVVIWTWVETFYVKSDSDKQWDLDRIRLSLPD